MTTSLRLFKSLSLFRQCCRSQASQVTEVVHIKAGNQWDIGPKCCLTSVLVINAAVNLPVFNLQPLFHQDTPQITAIPKNNVSHPGWPAVAQARLFQSDVFCVSSCVFAPRETNNEFNLLPTWTFTLRLLLFSPPVFCFSSVQFTQSLKQRRTSLIWVRV